MAESKASAEIEPKAEDYAPYHCYREFNEGYRDWAHGYTACPYNRSSIAAQAWDRGQEYAARLHSWELANSNSAAT